MRLNPVFGAVPALEDGHNHAAGCQSTVVLIHVFVVYISIVAVLVAVECGGDFLTGQKFRGTGRNPNFSEREARAAFRWNLLSSRTAITPL